MASRRRDLHGVGREARLTRCKTSTIQVVSEVELLILLLVAVATSAITAVVGAGGGLILLIVILQFVDPLVAVPGFHSPVHPLDSSDGRENGNDARTKAEFS